MNLRHGLLGLALVGSLAVFAAPVVAGSRWLLLAPPPVPESNGSVVKYNLSAPLDQWERLNAYDSEMECEDGKREWQKVAKIPPVKPPSLPYRRTIEEDAEEALREMTPEQRAQEQQWDETTRETMRWLRAQAKAQAKAKALVDLLKHLKCVPADAVYEPGVKRKP